MSEPWPPEDLERVEACPVCATRERDPLHAGLTDRVFGIAPGTWDLHRCRGCRSAFLDPRPTEASVGRAYAGGYVTHDPPAREPVPVGALARARRALRNGYVNRRYGYELTPASPAGRLVPALPPLRAETDRAFRHLPLPEPGAPLLDIGCGNGAAVVFLEQMGWDAEGHEIDADAAAQARAAGVEVTSEPLADLAVSRAGRYAAITLSHVIEHVHVPPAFLAQLRPLLRPGGRIWIATPNLDATGHERFGRDWMALDPPRHLVLFTRDSLAQAVQRAGFTDVRFPAPWSGTAGLYATSQALREGRRPEFSGPSPRRADALALLRPRRAEELAVTAQVPG